MLLLILGAKFGSGSYSSGIILDPPYFEIGENSIIGFGAVICSHALEAEKVSFEKIIIGKNVTIGLRAMLMPGVRIEDNAIVAAGALVTKNSHIKNGEVWAGIPAKRIKLGQEEIIPSIASYAS
jgi:acetyltransferase-like isoleucine patch superfamily enzyme